MTRGERRARERRGIDGGEEGIRGEKREIEGERRDERGEEEKR